MKLTKLWPNRRMQDNDVFRTPLYTDAVSIRRWKRKRKLNLDERPSRNWTSLLHPSENVTPYTTRQHHDPMRCATQFHHSENAPWPNSEPLQQTAGCVDHNFSVYQNDISLTRPAVRIGTDRARNLALQEKERKKIRKTWSSCRRCDSRPRQEQLNHKTWLRLAQIPPTLWQLT